LRAWATVVLEPPQNRLPVEAGAEDGTVGVPPGTAAQKENPKPGVGTMGGVTQAKSGGEAAPGAANPFHQPNVVIEGRGELGAFFYKCKWGKCAALPQPFSSFSIESIPQAKDHNVGKRQR
jgi:hypothetical protein